MSVYVDPATNYGDLGDWSHMVADTSKELHEMAIAIGLKRQWCQGPKTYFEHYDIRPIKRDDAIKRGAIPIGPRELVAITSKRRKVQP